MNSQLVEHLLKKLEIGSVVFLLLFAEAVNIPDSVSTVINFVSYGIVAFLIIRQWQRFAYVATRDVSLLLLVGVAVFSISWSESPSDTFTQLKGLLRSTIFGAYLATRYTPREQMRLLSWVVGIAAILSIAAALALPVYGTHLINGGIAWRGIYKHKQYLGRVMAIGVSVFLVATFDKRNNRWVALTGLGVALAIILLSQSKTGLILFLLLLLLMPFYKILRQKLNTRIVLLTVALLLIGSLAIFVSSNLETILVDVLGKDIEFNGRTPIWSLAIERGLERPLLGYGYAGFWPSDAGEYIINRTWASMIDIGHNFHAHNGFLDLFLQLGCLGLILFTFNLMMLLHRVITLFTLSKTIESFWMLGFIAIKLANNLSEAITILSSNNIFWIVYVSIALSSAVEYNRVRKNCYLSTSLTN